MGLVKLIDGIFLLFIITAGATGFKRCYDTSTETHCFEVQYAEDGQPLVSSQEDGRRRCSQLGATLIVIKDAEVNGLVTRFKNEPGNPIQYNYLWTDADRVDDNSNTWQWINRNLPNVQESDVANVQNSFYVAALELQSGHYILTAKRPHFSFYYICEYDESECSSVVSNAKIADGRCYKAYDESLIWYDARNRCLQGGGDLASFRNVASFDFSSLLDFSTPSNPPRAYFVGLRVTWYIWNKTGEEINYVNWMLNWGAFSHNIWDSTRCLCINYNCDVDCKLLGCFCFYFGNTFTVCHTVTSLSTTSTTTTSPILPTLPTSTLWPGDHVDSCSSLQDCLRSWYQGWCNCWCKFNSHCYDIDGIDHCNNV